MSAERVIEAARELLASKFDTIGKGKRRRGIESDDGEKCWVVHSDHVFSLENALQEYDRSLQGSSVPAPQVGALDEIAAERRRQTEVEGWTTAHDDEHDCGQLARAGACYALFGSLFEVEREKLIRPPSKWPWLKSEWKPKSPRRDLVRAAALIVAEIERLDRRAAITGKPAP